MPRVEFERATLTPKNQKSINKISTEIFKINLVYASSITFMDL